MTCGPDTDGQSAERHLATGGHSPVGGTRIVVAGKGGVGKTTLTAMLARSLGRSGIDVVAVDADEQMNLAVALGLDPEVAAALVPLAAAAAYVEEKTGAAPGEGAGGLLRLNPDVTDVVDRLAVPVLDRVRLLVMGGVRGAGAGCLCPETSLLAAVVRAMRLRQHEVVVMDTHAGVEHFGRSLALGFDQAVIVADPTFNAIQVGMDTVRLAQELGIATAHLVINRVRDADDLARALGHLDRVERGGRARFRSIRAVAYDPAALVTEPSIEPLLDGSVLGPDVAALGFQLVAPVPAPVAGVA